MCMLILTDIRKHINSIFSVNTVTHFFDWFSWLDMPLAYL